MTQEKVKLSWTIPDGHRMNGPPESSYTSLSILRYAISYVGFLSNLEVGIMKVDILSLIMIRDNAV
jgi:hypothetical protein